MYVHWILNLKERKIFEKFARPTRTHENFIYFFATLAFPSRLSSLNKTVNIYCPDMLYDSQNETILRTLRLSPNIFLD